MCLEETDFTRFFKKHVGDVQNYEQQCCLTQAGAVVSDHAAVACIKLCPWCMSVTMPSKMEKGGVEAKHV